MCHVPHVMCHVSRVTCHPSPVTCQKYYLNILIKKKKHSKNIGQSGGASRWRVCYQRGLPRLVDKNMHKEKPMDKTI